MTTILIVVAVIVIAALIYLASLDGDYVVRRSKLINAEPQRVFDRLRDFTTWAEWSPWLMHEPDTNLVFSAKPTEEGGYYTWDGKYVGAGKLTHVRFDAPRQIEQRIEFIRPFKSVCKVKFELEEKDGQTEVTWIMEGRMPFLFRFTTKQAVSMISKDYDLGLLFLSGVLDPQAEYPRIRFDGKTTFGPQACLCKPFAGDLATMQEAMKAGYPKLMEYTQEKGIELQGPPLAVYYKVNPKTPYFEGDMALPLAGEADVGEYQLRTFGGGSYYKVSLQGNYDFLELAWYATYTHLRMHKIKVQKSVQRPEIEVYENDPETVTNSNELLTSIYIPIKSAS